MLVGWLVGGGIGTSSESSLKQRLHTLHQRAQYVQICQLAPKLTNDIHSLPYMFHWGVNHILPTCIAGIAYDNTRKRLFVTGKYWPRIFEIVPKPLDATNAQNKQLVQSCYIHN